LISFLVCAVLLGCQGSETSPVAPPSRPAVPLTIKRGEAPTRVFSSEDEVPAISEAFEGGRGSVRVTMEVERSSTSTTPIPVSLNDVLFKAEGDGRILIAFKRPWPEHPNGRVTIRCQSGGEESSAEFEPELWFHLPAAIVTFESPPGEASGAVVERKEIVLGRYVARNIPQDIRLTFKAVFSRDPVPPRMKAGIKPPR
jgi:hypothetical protein